MEKERLNDIVDEIIRRKECRDVVLQVLEEGEQYTFTKIGKPRIYNGFRWTPIEDECGHILNIRKVICGRGIRFSSNKIEDRVLAVIDAIENGGLTLKVNRIEEIPLVIDGSVMYDELGNIRKTKRYYFEKKMI